MVAMIDLSPHIEGCNLVWSKEQLEVMKPAFSISPLFDLCVELITPHTMAQIYKRFGDMLCNQPTYASVLALIQLRMIWVPQSSILPPDRLAYRLTVVGADFVIRNTESAWIRMQAQDAKDPEGEMAECKRYAELLCVSN
jgi:hypothetical protein